jgi:predicted ribosome quality control (RQC) complex YloA/Tae2 family protein
MLFQPETFHRNESDSGKSFTDYNKAIQYYITHKFKYNNFIQTKKFLSSNLEKETAILSSKLNNLKSRIEKGSRENEYYNYGNLLLSNLGSVENNIKMIELTDYKTDSLIKIKLDPKLSAADNANLYFEKAKDEKKNYKISKELYETSKKKFETYINFRDRVLTINSIDELMEIKNLLNFRESIGKKKVEDKISYREYVLDNKYRVFVGRDSKSNDLLTVKYAKQNDYWFHARGLPGSHVVLRVDNPKEGIPKNILNNVASIAAFYSKAKTAKIAPVAYTLRKFVRKNKNMNPGQVLLSKESVLLVKPEIPNNAVEIEE